MASVKLSVKSRFEILSETAQYLVNIFFMGLGISFMIYMCICFLFDLFATESILVELLVFLKTDTPLLATGSFIGLMLNINNSLYDRKIPFSKVIECFGSVVFEADRLRPC